MKQLSVFTLFFFAVTITATAQRKLNPKPRDVEWADRPELHDVPPEYNKEPALILLQDVNLDYRYEGKGVNMYYTVHRIVKVLDEKGIASFNAIGFSVNSHTRVPLIKARTILPNGKVQDIANDMIKVTKDEYGRHKIIIAMEGVAKNAEIELLVKEIKPGYFFGSEDFQYSVPLLNARFRMSYPRELVFEEKGYNGFPTAYDTLINNRRHIEITKSDIPALTPEPYSFYDVNCMRAEYRIRNFNFANENDRSRVDTWDEMARKMWDEHYKITDKERAAVNRYLTELGAHAGGDEAENIKKIENGIKNNIVLYSYLDNEHDDDLDSVIAKKAATSTGYIKLFAACFTQALVKHELGMAGDRTEHRFDSKFENWDNMDDYIFYFPNQKKFLSPTSIYCRYPIVPNSLTSGKGVFCLIPPKGIVTGALAEIRTITPLPTSESQRNIAADVFFTDDMDAQVDISYSYTGYAATDLRKALMLGTKDREEDLIEKIVTIADKKKDIVKYSVSNVGFDNYYTNKPLEITATVHTSSMTDKADKQYLLKIGEMIGQHGELYSDKKRVLPIDFDYPASFTHTITINIPKGYKIVNPEATHMQADYVDRNLVSLVSFKSDYALINDKKNGDKLIVTVTENYPQVHFPVADYQRFREVVNTGADFNKVTLLLAKKGSL